MFSGTKRLSGVKELTGTAAHWEPRRGTHQQAAAYCSKEETRIDGPWEVGTPPVQGKRKRFTRSKTAYRFWV